MLQRTSTGQPIFKFISEERSMKLRDLTNEEQKIYECIEDSGSMGVMPNSLKFLVNG